MREMEACWPSSVGLRGRALNRPVLRWLKTVVVSDQGKGAALIASGGDQEDVPEAFGGGDLGRACAVEASKRFRRHRNRGSCFIPRDEPGGCPRSWPGGARRGGGVILVCGSCTEREKASVDTATGVAGPQGRERERAEAATEGTEYRGDARRRTGP